MCFHVLQAPCCGKLYVCRLCHDAEENHEMDRFKVMEVQCSECQTTQQVSEAYSPSLADVAGPPIPLMPQVLVMYFCLYWCLFLFKGTADLWAVPCTVWRILLWYLPLVWQGQKAISLSTLWNMQVSNSFSFHFRAVSIPRKKDTDELFDYLTLLKISSALSWQVINVKWGWFWSNRLTDIQCRARDLF